VRTLAVLVALTLVAGYADAIAFFGLGVFTANMTGNTVLLGGGIVAAVVPALKGTIGIALPLLSIACFVAGAVLAAAIGHPRGVLATIAVAIAGTAAMQHLGANVWVPVEVGVLSAVMGAQSIVATRLGVPGISTTFVTGTMVRAVMDFAGTKPESPEILTEGRANAYVWACYLAGAVAGGFALTGLGANALWLPAVVVAVLAGVI
jgi:uncharacterized membrane protein YoaK (UPF0700 family)